MHIFQLQREFSLMKLYLHILFGRHNCNGIIFIENTFTAKFTTLIYAFLNVFLIIPAVLKFTHYHGCVRHQTKMAVLWRMSCLKEFLCFFLYEVNCTENGSVDMKLGNWVACLMPCFRFTITHHFT